MVINSIALSISTLLYFFAYHAYWYQSNTRPWLAELYYGIYFSIFPAKPTSSTEVSVQAIEANIMYEDKVIFISFVISSLLAVWVLFHTFYLKGRGSKRKKLSKLQVGFAAYASALLLMSIWFLWDNQLRLKF